jgi:hypothetical protein
MVPSWSSLFRQRLRDERSSQAERMRSLGWADYLSVQMAANRKSMVASYWMYGRGSLSRLFPTDASLGDQPLRRLRAVLE